MIHVYPDFYKEFHCLAGDCPNSCCKDWAVVVDPAAARRYESLEGPLKEKLRQVMEHDEDGDLVFRLEPGGLCPFWEEDGLCQLQRQLGEEALCATCQKFPRLTQDYGDFIEHGLTIGCPEGARLILTKSNPRTLIRTEDQLPGEETDLDPDFLAQLEAAREELLNQLWLEEDPEKALAACLLHAQWFQDQLDGIDTEPWDQQAALTRLSRAPADSALTPLLELHLELDPLDHRWQQMLCRAREVQVPSTPNEPLGQMGRNLAEEYLCRYWLQGVNDGDCLSPMILLGVNYLIVRHLARMAGAKTGPVSQILLLELFCQYAKEVEHDDQNRQVLLDSLDQADLYHCTWLAREILFH